MVGNLEDVHRAGCGLFGVCFAVHGEVGGQLFIRAPSFLERDVNVSTVIAGCNGQLISKWMQNNMCSASYAYGRFALGMACCASLHALYRRVIEFDECWPCASAFQIFVSQFQVSQIRYAVT